MFTEHLFGAVKNTTYDSEIMVQGSVNGTLDKTIQYVDANVYYPGYTTGYVVMVNELSGVLSNFDANVLKVNHVLNLNKTNMLGRKSLSFEQPLFGKNLNLTSNNLDKNQLYANESWYIIEYINNVLDDNMTYDQLKTHNIQLATPTYIKSLQSIPEIENNTLETFNQSEEYYVYYNDNIITISSFTVATDYIPSDNVLMGPIFDFDLCHTLISGYAEVNNCKIKKENDNTYSISGVYK